MKPAVWYSAVATAAMLPLIYMVVWRVLTGPFSIEIQSMVIGAVVSGVLQAVVQFWLGTSASSQRKTEREAAKAEGNA